ncbi:hypothetical protein [Rhizobium sp. UGM030330-04]|uniref:hypothetical protein n=1 Tax=Pseudomonadota TaxID=1224 RepID=UPI000D949A42|nr:MULTISPECIES: hypothetical protein [Pseudomonadota]PYG52830.1 histidine kinase/DNA gyrase B/HSP90-like ATPase [Rhizobium sp. UGM030330-04]
MNLHTNLQGRLRNTRLPKSHGLWPVFETVVNSIHSLEERGNIKTEGKITLRISRAFQASLELDGESRVNDIEGFVVEDNGIGFNDTNMKSFETLDSDHKIEKGGRGVGRLLWLKAFDRVEINSDFKDSQGKPMHRVISFDAKSGVELVEEKESILFSYDSFVEESRVVR